MKLLSDQFLLDTTYGRIVISEATVINLQVLLRIQRQHFTGLSEHLPALSKTYMQPMPEIFPK